MNIRITTTRGVLGRAFCTLLVCLFGAAPWAAAQAPAVPDASKLPPQSKPIADVVVPIPSEVFGTLDKFANSNWRAVQRSGLSRAKPQGDQTQSALLLGAVIAEGFIAVEAEDAAEVKEIGRTALALARALGVESAVIRRSKSIVDAAEKNHWAAVRKEWDEVLPDVQQGMKEMVSAPLSQLVSVGGWLRGTDALTTLILQRYSAEGAELLRQPAMLDYFEKQLGKVDASDSVTKMQEGIRKMRLLVAGSSQPISEKSVKDLAAVCHELLGTINAQTDR